MILAAWRNSKHGGDAHDDAIEARIAILQTTPGVENIRKNQTQVDFNGNRVGNNRPDIQFDQNGQHHNVEYDTDPNRSAHHATVIPANDPAAVNEFHILP